VISVVIPARNEAGNIAATLAPLQALRRRGHEVIVVDGGSGDATVTQAQPLADQVIASAPGRARQMNAGAQAAHGEVLWFLHADTLAPLDADRLLLAALDSGAVWGRFDVRLSGRQPLLRVVERLMNLRSCLSGIATGDQGLFVRRAAFDAVGGFPDQPLMEDIALSARLKRLGRPSCLRTPLITSSRRWEERGILRTILLMWRLRLLYALGADPARLARLYR
jgi:rSAM/selenodomain-associated transferase 2